MALRIWNLIIVSVIELLENIDLLVFERQQVTERLVEAVTSQPPPPPTSIVW